MVGYTYDYNKMLGIRDEGLLVLEELQREADRAAYERADHDRLIGRPPIRIF